MLVGGVQLAEHVPERYRDLRTFDNTGDSYIIDPRGEVIAGPAEGEMILTANGSLESVLAAKVACDVGGHYSRPDVLQLLVNGRPIEGVVEGVGPYPVPRLGVDISSESDLDGLVSPIHNEQQPPWEASKDLEEPI